MGTFPLQTGRQTMAVVVFTLLYTLNCQQICINSHLPDDDID